MAAAQPRPKYKWPRTRGMRRQQDWAHKMLAVAAFARLPPGAPVRLERPPPRAAPRVELAAGRASD